MQAKIVSFGLMLAGQTSSQSLKSKANTRFHRSQRQFEAFGDFGMRQAVIKSGLQQGELFFWQGFKFAPYNDFDLVPVDDDVRGLGIGGTQEGVFRIQVRSGQASMAVNAPVTGDAEDPGRDRGLCGVVLIGLAPDVQHHFLNDFFRGQRVTAQTNEIAFEAGREMFEQLGEGGATALTCNPPHAIGEMRAFVFGQNPMLEGQIISPESAFCTYKALIMETMQPRRENKSLKAAQHPRLISALTLMDKTGWC